MRPALSIQATDGAARVGRLVTAHGSIDTPAFMPVGTYGSVKGMTPEELTGLGAQIVLANTFHLMLRPGTAVIAAHAGLHQVIHDHRTDCDFGADIQKNACSAECEARAR